MSSLSKDREKYLVHRWNDPNASEYLEFNRKVKSSLTRRRNGQMELRFEDIVRLGPPVKNGRIDLRGFDFNFGVDEEHAPNLFLYGKSVIDTDFDFARMSGVRRMCRHFVRCSFRGVRIRFSYIDGDYSCCSFDNALINGSTLGAPISPIRGSSFNSCSFDNVRFTSCVTPFGEGALFNDCSFNGTKITHVIAIRSVFFRNCSFSALLNDVRIVGGSFIGVRRILWVFCMFGLSYPLKATTKFIGCDLSGTVFVDVFVGESVQFIETKLPRLKVSKAKFGAVWRTI